MRPIVNVFEEDRAADTGNMHKILVKTALVVLETSLQTDPQTNILITIASAPTGKVITKATINSQESTDPEIPLHSGSSVLCKTCFFEFSLE